MAGWAGSGTRQETAVTGEQVWVAQKKSRCLHNSSRGPTHSSALSESLTPQPCRGDLHSLYQAYGKKPHKALPCPEEALVYKYLRKCSALLVIKKKKKNPQIKTTTKYHFFPFKLTSLSLKLTGISKQEFPVTAGERAC